jgi:hypothetical protein
MQLESMALQVAYGEHSAHLSIRHGQPLSTKKGSREAAQLLVDYIELQDDDTREFDPPCSLASSSKSSYTVIELGSGTGYVGLKIVKGLRGRGRSNDLMVLTDLPDVCPLLERNLAISRQKYGIANTMVAPLSWGNYEQAVTLLKHPQISGGRNVTHIVCSDLVSEGYHRFS